jgi:hypothetical protein
MTDVKNANLDVQKAYERIKTLRVLSRKVGVKTDKEQYEILLSLSNQDALQLADILYRERTATGPEEGR